MDAGKSGSRKFPQFPADSHWFPLSLDTADTQKTSETYIYFLYIASYRSILHEFHPNSASCNRILHEFYPSWASYHWFLYEICPI